MPEDGRSVERVAHEQIGDVELELQIPEYYDELSEEDKLRWLDRNLSKDDLYEQIIVEADLPPKENTGSYPFKKEHLLHLLLFVRGDSDE